MTDTMSKALEAAKAAMEQAAHIKVDVSNYGLSADYEIVNPEEMAKAAISAYLAHLAEDEELTP